MNHRLTNLILIILLQLFGSCAFSAESSSLKQNYLFFPFAHMEIRPNLTDDQDLKTFEAEVGSDFFYLLNYKKFRTLAEFAFTNEEFELERLQFGLDITPGNTLWLGRFHSPLGYWNSTYHHGLHLQTSVHRPGIIEYEDSGGILPNHVTGMLLNGEQYTKIGTFKYSAAAGYAPTLDGTLEPYTFGEVKNQLLSIVKFAYQADETSPTESGVVISQSIINSEMSNIDYIKQKIFGLYTHQSLNNIRLTASGYLINNSIRYQPGSQYSASFIAGYIHAEYDLAMRTIVYSRLERAFGAKDDPYLALFDHYETERNLGGVRYELTRRQALSVEISQRINSHDSHTHISIQWSAVFP